MKRFLLMPLLLTSCATSGAVWMRQNHESWDTGELEAAQTSRLRRSAPLSLDAPSPTRERGTVTLSQRGSTTNAPLPFDGAGENEPRTQITATGKTRPPRHNIPLAPLTGRVLGIFRNTYYNFPDAREFEGKTVFLHDGRCNVIAEVPRTFFETLCVQGSGLLSNGTPVSFHNRDCPCAEICPRTEQKICFDSLSSAQFPWGRGATGLPITPLSTVAVDSTIIPLGTTLYIPEYDGIPRDQGAQMPHDGCFIAQDRGLKVQGQHVDIFTGRRETTEYFNNLVPSNSGVTVVIDSPRCSPPKAVRTQPQ